MWLLRFICAFVLILPLSAEAGFFDDLFGSGEDEPEVGDYSMVLRDISSDANLVSHDAKTFKLKIYYPEADQAKIGAKTNGVLNSALADALSITSINSETAVESELEDLGFTLRYKAAKSKYDGMLEIQYISNELVLDQPQRLHFSFNAKQFLRLINLDADPDADTVTGNIYIKPIIINAKKPIVDGIIHLDDPVETASLVQGYGFVGNFTDIEDDPIVTQVDNGDISFSYKLNGKTKNPVLKLGANKYSPTVTALTPSLVAYDDNVMSLTAEFSLTTVETLSAGTYSLILPLELETQTLSGLKVLLRGVAKGKIDIP